MTDFVIALSGGIGAGKTDLAERLAATLDADRVSFGREVREFAERNQRNQNDRAVLQELGQAMVLTDCEGFVRRVLAQRDEGGRQRKPGLIVEGVRHVEVFKELGRQLGDRTVHLVHISTPEATREKRVMDRDNVERRVVARYDNDITEAQVPRILPQYAALTLNGDLPLELQVATVEKKLREWAPTARMLASAG